MPKMPERFYAEKREKILDAAQRIAMEKPLPHVTMKDLIRACGVSQGAIYHYFSSLDEIWLGLVERFYQADDLLGRFQQIFAMPRKPEETVKLCMGALCENLQKTIPVYGKLVLELNTLVQANPGRFGALRSAETAHSRLDRMLELFDNWCREQVQAGAIRPQVSLTQLSLYLCSSYLGLRYHAAALHLQPELSETGLDKYLDLQRQSWQITLLCLLGLEEHNENGGRGWSFS